MLQDGCSKSDRIWQIGTDASSSVPDAIQGMEN